MTMRFSVARVPGLVLGEEIISALPRILHPQWRHILLVTGETGWTSPGIRKTLLDRLTDDNHAVSFYHIHGEPSPETVDTAVSAFRDQVDAVVSIGGGSVLDAGKAIAAMLCENESVETFLESVGTRSPSGKTLPFIACPTTAGTGAEATMNAVISRPGPQGFKKSLRHAEYIPFAAVIDPNLSMTCPEHITRASALDALSQLIEAYTSTGASPFTDALCEKGMENSLAGLSAVFEHPFDYAARARLSLAAWYSGIALVNAGLGLVHGIASVLGGRIAAPHGVICGTFLPRVLKAFTKEKHIPGHLAVKLRKIEHISGMPLSETIGFIEGIASRLPPLSQYGFTGLEFGDQPDPSLNKNALLTLGSCIIRDIVSENTA